VFHVKPSAKSLATSPAAGIQEFFADETVRPIGDFRGLIAAGHYTREMEAEAEEKLPRSKSGRRKMNANRRSTSNDLRDTRPMFPKRAAALRLLPRSGCQGCGLQVAG